MHNTSIHLWRVRGVCIFAILMFIFAMLKLTGCVYPKIKENPWEYIRVVYLIRENGKLKPQSWHARDRTLLSRLQATFHNEGEYVVSPKPHLSKIHRVDIKLRNGQWWILTYFPQSNDIAIMNAHNVKGTFLLKNSSPEIFFTALTNEIWNATGIVVDLNIRTRYYGELDELGENNAAYYDRHPYE